MTAGNPKIILYTNHRCPWAHRTHIALTELGLPYEEVLVDLSKPRTPEYLAINPRGLVPSLSYNGEILTESAVTTQFLADAHPSHLVPESNAPGGALRRARIAWFVDTFISKVQGPSHKLFTAETDAEAEAIVKTVVAAVSKEVEGVLADAKPFFGRSDKLTLAECLTGSFALRLHLQMRTGVFPASLAKELQEQTPNFWKWLQATATHPSVTAKFDEQDIIESTKERIKTLRAAAAAATAK